jgi:hypothetical protein
VIFVAAMGGEYPAFPVFPFGSWPDCPMLKFRTLAQSRLVQSQVSSLRRVGVLPDCSGICASGQAISAVSREPAGQTEIPVRLSTMVDKPASLGIAQRLGNLGDDRVAKRRIRHLGLALAHHTLGQLTRIELFKCRRQMSAISRD